MGSFTLRQRDIFEYMVISGARIGDAWRATYGIGIECTDAEALHEGRLLLENSSRVKTAREEEKWSEELKVREMAQQASEEYGITREWLISKLKKCVHQCLGEESVRVGEEGKERLVYTYNHSAVGKHLELLGRALGLLQDNSDETRIQVVEIGISPSSNAVAGSLTGEVIEEGEASISNNSSEVKKLKGGDSKVGAWVEAVLGDIPGEDDTERLIADEWEGKITHDSERHEDKSDQFEF